MNSRTRVVVFHAIGWLIFLSIPVLIMPTIAVELTKIDRKILTIPMLLSSLSLVGIFYLNYFLLIPKFLFARRYFLYAVLSGLSMFFSFAMPRIVLFILDIGPFRQFEQSAVLSKIFPLVITNTILMFTVIFLASIVLRLNNRWKQTEEEKLSAQLAYLKTQINPHFLFNTLNSIYGVTIGKAPEAAEMVSQLSEMMRYTLRESQYDYVPLTKELQYIENYVELQKNRMDETIEFDFEIVGNPSSLQIAPLILIPFIENAFKHGINAEQESKIWINIEIKDYQLYLTVHNNKVDVQSQHFEHSGIGVHNTKNRLRLIYPDQHLLSIVDSTETYQVSLHLNLR